MAEGSVPAPALKTRLSVMMFLQYAIWGAWLPLLWPFLNGHLGFTPGQIGDMFAVGAAGAIFAPFIAGQIADRFFSTEKFLAVSHIAGAALVWQLSHLTTYNQFLGFSLAYSLVYSPTLSLTNSLAFHHLPDRDRDFGKVRLWGTIGWICVGIGIGQYLLHAHTPATGTPEEITKAQQAGMTAAFKLSAVLGVVMGLFCFTLPHTPPSKEKRNNATAEAIGEVLRSRALAVLFLLLVPVSCIHQFYFVHTSEFLGTFQSQAATDINKIFGVGGGGLMTIGQMAEITVLAIMPFALKRFSRKALLGVGLLAYGLRMAVFAFGPGLAANAGVSPIPLLMVGVAMHGLCFGCFIFVSFVVVDELTTKDVRASAQSLFALVIFGIGIIVGSKVAGMWAESSKLATGKLDYVKLFAMPMWASLGCLMALLLFYPNRARKAEDGQ
ncbi:MAG: MFS transporter [Phycisphaerales bacterium]|nr:MFS transporter [Phycisphaerales bacterium]